MATKIVTKNSSTASAVPTASDLVQGELAVNVADKRLFTENNAGAIVELGTNPYNFTANHNGSAKLATTSTGIDVTGTATMDGLTSSGNLTFDAVAINKINSNGFLYYDIPAGYTHTFTEAGNTKKLLDLTSGGDISFYEDTGTTAKFFWDASAESLGIGTSSPSRKLDVNGSGIVRGFLTTYGAGVNNALFLNNTAYEWAAYTNASNNFEITDWNLAQTRLTIDTSGNVGVGTSSPSEKLHVVGGNIKTDSSTRQIGYWEADAVHDGYFVPYNASGQSELVNSFTTGGLIFKTGTSKAERMRIDSSGNLLVGTTSSPSSSDVKQVVSSSTGAFTQYSYNGGGGSVIGAPAASEMAFYTTSGNIGSETYTERMRIDSSGHFIVGATSAFTSSSFCVDQSGLGQFRRDGTPLIIRRDGSDGGLIDFEKDGASVGSIGTEGNDIAFGNGDAGIQVLDGTRAVRPFNMTANSRSDNAVNLGTTNARWKDLYLSGGVYLGGTGAANKLDDYEEGTWTPVIAGSGGGAYTYSASATARYTKIGNLVTLSAAITNITTSGSGHAGYVQIQGAPFNKDSSTFATGAIELSAGNMNSGLTYANVSFITASLTSVMYIRQSGDNSNGADFPVGGINSGNTDFNFTITYRTA